MKRFQVGDLAITCNSRAPSVNDGHLVTILEVLGPRPGWNLSFGYEIERVDGQPFGISSDAGSPMPGRPRQRVAADQHNLKPLREGHDAQAASPPPEQLTAD